MKGFTVISYGVMVLSPLNAALHDEPKRGIAMWEAHAL